MPSIRKHQKFDGVYFSGSKQQQRIYTINADKGRSIYGEKIVEEGDIEYRDWNPYRSKLAAAILNNCRNIYLSKNSNVLYLGASSGTTVSHFSDIVTKGVIYSVEFSPRSLRELVQNCVDRKNIIPILGDANRPFEYAKFISTPIDIIYMDVAQPNQAEILIKNTEWFLKAKGGFVVYAIKARSIDTTGSPHEIFKEEIKHLEQAGFEITDQINIAPFSEDHLMLFARYNPKIQ